MKFWTADWHLHHNGIIKYCNRPFKNVQDMHKGLIANHNELVTTKDEVWHLGDLTMLGPSSAAKVAKLIAQFHGQLNLVVGNHDKWRIQTYENHGFWTIHSAMWFDYEGIRFYMMHDPVKYTVIENEPKSVMLCGHIHRLFKHLLPHKRVINVGVDVWDYKPVSFEEILALLDDYEVFK